MRARLRPRLLRWAAFVLMAVAGAAVCQAPVATGPVPAEGGASAAATRSAAAPAAAPLRRLSIGVASRSASNLVQYAGIEHGIFARHGFDVDVQQLRSTIAPAALQSDQIDYLTGVDSAVRASCWTGSRRGNTLLASASTLWRWTRPLGSGFPSPRRT